MMVKFMRFCLFGQVTHSDEFHVVSCKETAV